MKLIQLTRLHANQHISGGTPSGSIPVQLEIETTEGKLDLIVSPSMPMKPVPPFIKHTIDEHKIVLIGPKD